MAKKEKVMAKKEKVMAKEEKVMAKKEMIEIPFDMKGRPTDEIGLHMDNFINQWFDKRVDWSRATVIREHDGNKIRFGIMVSKYAEKPKEAVKVKKKSSKKEAKK